MIYIRLVSEVYKAYVSSLKTFLVESCSVDKNDNILLNNTEYRRVARDTANMVIKDIPNEHVIINDVRWEHIIEPKLSHDLHIDTLRSTLQKRRYYVSTFFPKELIPSIIFDLRTAELDGDLKDAIYGVF